MKVLPYLVVVADRGHMVAFLRADNLALRKLETMEISEAVDRLGEQFTDKAGAFPNTVSMGQGNSAAERMSLSMELETRAIRKIARHIQELCELHRPDTWGFAAPPEINGAILGGLDSRWKDRLVVNLHLDLTHHLLKDITQRFAEEAALVSPSTV